MSEGDVLWQGGGGSDRRAAVQAEARAVYEHWMGEQSREQGRRELYRAVLAQLRTAHAAQPAWSQEVGVRVRAVAAHYRRYGPRVDAIEEGAERVLIERVREVHEVLWGLNYRLRVVDNLQRRHARALLEHWVGERARDWIAPRWEALRWWADHCLGKPAMVPPLAVWWAQVEPVRAVRGAQASATRGASVLSDEAAARVGERLAQLDERAGWLWRMTRQWPLTLAQALRVDAWADTAHEGWVRVREVDGREAGMVPLQTEEQRALAEALRAWSGRQHRTVGWVELTEKAARNRYDYLVRSARQGLSTTQGER